MKIQNNKTKISTIVIATLVIGLVLLSPNTVLPQINAQQNIVTYKDVPDTIKGKWATLTEQSNQNVKQRLDGHPGWIGIISVGNGKVSIDYIGPASTNPYHYKGWNQVKSNTPLTTPKSNAPLQISCSVVESESESPQTYESGYTTAYHIKHNPLAVQSGSSTVDYLVNLNAWSGDDSTWMQNGILYDNADCTGTGAGWYANFDSHAAGNVNSNSGYPIAHPMTVTAGDNINEDTYAAGSGQYQEYVTDTANGNSTEIIDNVGDSVNTLVLRQYASGNYEQDSGTQTEEPTSNGSTWNWGNKFFYFALYHTSSDPGTTVCNSWFNPVPTNGPNNPVITSTNNNPCYDEMNYP